MKNLTGIFSKRAINIAIYLEYSHDVPKCIPFSESSLLKGFKINVEGDKEKAENQYDIKKTSAPLESHPFFEFEYDFMRHADPKKIGIVFRHQLLHFDGVKKYSFVIDDCELISHEVCVLEYDH